MENLIKKKNAPRKNIIKKSVLQKISVIQIYWKELEDIITFFQGRHSEGLSLFYHTLQRRDQPAFYLVSV